MFNLLPEQPQDKIMLVMQQFAADPRPGKIDLGIGVYKDAEGRTPIMRAVKAAEKRVWEEQQTKVYTALAGDPAFIGAMSRLILGPEAGVEVAGAATVGGTGAVHQALQLAKMARPDATVHVPNPSWVNHAAIVGHVGLGLKVYRYFDAASGGLDWDGLVADLSRVPAGDVVLLHGCCHNPTGANPSAAQWAQIAEIAARQGFLPLIDLAYQGFGDSLDEDAAGTRMIVAAVDEALIAASCSKNFGIYRDRAGVALATCREADARRLAQGALTSLNRMTYSFAPDHAARIVTTILNDADLRADWEAELNEITAGMRSLRRQLADALRTATNSDRFDFVADHRGMFSLLGLTEDQVARIREEAGIYMIGDSRINIAGLTPDTAARLARAVAAVL